MIYTGTTYSYSRREEWGMVRKDEGETEVHQASTTYSAPCLASETLGGSVWVQSGQSWVAQFHQFICLGWLSTWFIYIW